VPTQPSTPILIAQQLLAIHDACQLYAQQLDSGNAFVCSDLVHLWSKFWDKSQGTKILIMYNGEDIRGPFGTASVLGRVDRKFLVVVSRGRGMVVGDRGFPLYQTYQNEQPLFTTVEQVRDVLRTITFDPGWCENPNDYKGIMPFVGPREIIVDAYSIEFSIGTQLPVVTINPE
jgi:hypothetical protein